MINIHDFTKNKTSSSCKYLSRVKNHNLRTLEIKLINYINKIHGIVNIDHCVNIVYWQLIFIHEMVNNTIRSIMKVFHKFMN